MAIRWFSDLPVGSRFTFVLPDSLAAQGYTNNTVFEKTGERKYTNAFGHEYTIKYVNSSVRLFKLPQRLAGTSVSSGTLKLEDLIDAVDSYLPPNLVRMFHKAWSAAVRDAWERKDRKVSVKDIGFDDFSPDHQDEISAIWHEDIYDYLNSVAPYGCYFGAHPGDGADIGFWRDEND